MGFQISPGVEVKEIDLTTGVPAPSTTAAGFAGRFVWGPVEQRILITSESELVSRFGKPDSNTFVSFFSAADFLAYGNELRTVRAANTAARNAVPNSALALLIKNDEVYENSYLDGSGTFGAWAGRCAGALGNSLKVSQCASVTAYSLNLSSVSITANAAVVGDVTVNTGIGSNTYVIVGDYVKLGSNPYIKVTGTSSNTFTLASPLTANVSAGTSILRKWEFADEFDSAPGTSAYVSNLAGANDEIHVVVVDRTGLISGTPGTIIEKYPFLSKASDAKSDDGSSIYYPTVIFNKSQWIYWGDHDTQGTNWGSQSAATSFTLVHRPITDSLAGGVDAALTTGDILRAYDLFSDPETVTISLLISGDADATIGTYLIDNIAEVRKDCMVFLSPPRSTVVNNAGSEADAVVAYRNTLPSSSYAALDCAWKYRYDKYNDTYRYTPLNADIAGLCVRTDLTRDPWYSPAGYVRGAIKNCVRFSWVPNLAARNTLYRSGVNPVANFPGEGNILYGDKTLLTRPSAFDRIPVRRLFIALEVSIARYAKYSLFEFNDEFTRAAFVSAVEPFLRDVQGRRGITDFEVRCDGTNNTPQIIDSNSFVGDIYVKPARSINFITLNFVAIRTGVSFEEIIGRF